MKIISKAYTKFKFQDIITSFYSREKWYIQTCLKRVFFTSSCNLTISPLIKDVVVIQTNLRPLYPVMPCTISMILADNAYDSGELKCHV